jgi:hypothetical protein
MRCCRREKKGLPFKFEISVITAKTVWLGFLIRGFPAFPLSLDGNLLCTSMSPNQCSAKLIVDAHAEDAPVNFGK